MCIRDSAGRGDTLPNAAGNRPGENQGRGAHPARAVCAHSACLLYTSDAADERSSVDLGGRRIIKKQTRLTLAVCSAS